MKLQETATAAAKIEVVKAEATTATTEQKAATTITEAAITTKLETATTIKEVATRTELEGATTIKEPDTGTKLVVLTFQ